MTIPYLIAIANTFIWLIPPFRQYRTKYFLFFLLIAVSDPLAITLWKSFQIIPSLVYLIMNLFLLCSLLKIHYLKIVSAISLTIILILFQNVFKHAQIDLLNTFMNIIILVVIISDFLRYIVENDAISLFYVFLISWELSMVLKYLVSKTDLIQGPVLFYITTFFQIFFGIIFSFVNINSKSFPISKKIIS